MILFFDTSALIKRYILESGSQKVDELFSEADNIILSPITKIELYSTIKRLLITKSLNEPEYEKLKKNVEDDFKYFMVLPFDKLIEEKALSLIEKYQLKTLDSIQLASCMRPGSIIKSFIVSDFKLKNAAISEKLNVIDPAQFTSISEDIP